MRIRHFLITTLLSLLAGLSIAANSPAPGAANQPFLVFDGLLYTAKPDLRALGMRPMRGINPPTSINKASDPVDDEKVRATLEDLRGYAGAVYLDYEMWPTLHASSAELSANIKKYARVVQLAHEIAPAARFGLYNVIPCWDYWGLVKNDRPKVKEWRDCNIRMDELARHVDIIMPSLYTFYNDPQGWDLQAGALLQAARRYNKPVYAFLWPEFHVSNRFLKGKNLPGNFWRHELEFCKSRADGVVIWGGWQEQWIDNADWWLETKAFLVSLDSR